MDGILDRSVTPVLAVPAKGLDSLNQVLIAFDGSLGSARALHDFTRYAQPYDPEIKIVIAEKEESEADFLLDHAAAYLRSHGLDNIETKRLNGPIRELVDDGELLDYDLIVSGIHSKKFLKDMFVGSFTKSLIDIGEVALFLSH